MVFVILTASCSADIGKQQKSPEEAWTILRGTDRMDIGYKIIADSSDNLYITGITEGDLDGNENQGGGTDVFLTKFDSDGKKLWTRQWGDYDDDESHDVVLDSSGNIYVIGETHGSIDGMTDPGEGCEDLPCPDGFLSKFDSEGDVLWTKQFGTEDSDYVRALFVDKNNNVFVVGSAKGGLDGETGLNGSDIFIIKFDSDGEKLWTKFWETDLDVSCSSAVIDDEGNFYFAGIVFKNEENDWGDVFIAKFDPEGNEEWMKQWGTSKSDFGNSLKIDSEGGIFVAGDTIGYDEKKSDLFIVKWNSEGDEQFSRIWGDPSKGLFGNELSIDKNDNIYLIGAIDGDYEPSEEDDDSGELNQIKDRLNFFVSKISKNGNPVWTKVYSTEGDESGIGITNDKEGNLYLTGYSESNLNGKTNSGDFDIFLIKFNAEDL